MRHALLTAAALALFPAAASAQQPRERPETLGKLLECRAISAAEERLGCYDRAAAALEQAEASGDLIAFDREEMRRTRRSLFGLSLPALRIFGGGDDGGKDEAEDEIEATIRSVSRAGGKWAFEIDDGARWVQTDNRMMVRDPRPGQPVRIRRGALGSYLANVDGQIAIRVRRER